MRFHAKQFALGLGDGYREALNLGRAVDKVAQASRRAFSASATAPLNAGLQRSMGLVRQLSGLMATMGAAFTLKSLADMNDRLYTADALIAGITRSQESVNEAQRTARDLSNQTGISYLNAYEGMSKMLTVSQGNVAKAAELTKLASALAAIDPSQGFEGALFALKEIESGDTISLRERFNIRVPTQKEAQEIAKKDGRSVQQVMFDSLQGYLDKSYGGGESGQGVEFLLNIRANTIGGQLSRIGNSFANIFTPLLLPFLQKTTGLLMQIGNWVSANAGRIEGLFTGMVAAGAPVVNALLPVVSSLFGQIGSTVAALAPVVGAAFAGIASAVAGLWPTVQGVIGGLLRLVAAIVPVIARVAGAIWSVLGPAVRLVGNALGGIVNALAGFFERQQGSLLRLVDGLGLFVRAVLGVAVFVVKYVGWIVSGIWSAVKFIGGLAAWALENNPFTWMLRMVDTVFPTFRLSLSRLWDWIKGGFGSLFDWLWNKFLQPIFKAFASLWDVLGMGDDKGATAIDPRAAYESERDDRQERSLLASLGITPGGKGMGTMGAPGAMGVNDALKDGVSGSREAIKNITINIGKQIESLTFTDVKSVTQAVDTVRREVERVMLDAVNQSNYAS